jgi:queuine tRNA-ribosyltransferase
MNSANARVMSPIEETCQCYTCQHFTRAYLRHLIVAKEMLASTLISIHNIQFLVTLMKNARNAILEGTFVDFANGFLTGYTTKHKEHA